MNFEEHIDRYIYAKKDEIVQGLFSLIRIPSVKMESKEGAPYGTSVREALDDAALQMKNLGYAVIIPTHGKYGYCEFGEGNKVVGIMPHLDVVSAEGDWSSPPFQPKMEDGFVWGRGSSDDKGGAIASMYAFDALCKSGLVLNNKVRLIFGCNEETGMDDVDALREDDMIPDFTLVPDAFFAIGVGHKGRVSVKAKMKEHLDCVTSFVCGRENYASVPDCAESMMPYSEERDAELRTLIQGTNLYLESDQKVIKLCAHGKSAHPAMPEGSMNAAWLLSDTLAKMDSLTENDRAIFTRIATMTSGIYGEGLGIQYADDLSGHLTSVCVHCESINGQLLLQFNIRFCVTMDRTSLLERITNGFASNGCEILNMDAGASHLFQVDHTIIPILKGAYKDATGKEADTYVHPGGTYAAKLGDAVIFGNEFRTPSLFGLSKGGPHQVDEVTNLESLYLSIKVYAYALKAIQEKI